MPESLPSQSSGQLEAGEELLTHLVLVLTNVLLHNSFSILSITLQSTKTGLLSGQRSASFHLLHVSSIKMNYLLSSFLFQVAVRGFYLLECSIKFYRYSARIVNEKEVNGSGVWKFINKYFWLKYHSKCYSIWNRSHQTSQPLILNLGTTAPVTKSLISKIPWT